MSGLHRSVTNAIGLNRRDGKHGAKTRKLPGLNHGKKGGMVRTLLSEVMAAGGAKSPVGRNVLNDDETLG